MPKISVIIPVFNEEDSLKELHREISEVAEANQYQLEYVFVDDGSTDRSWVVLSELADSDSRVQCIRFRRNFVRLPLYAPGRKPPRVHCL
jgi:glycosyltransferase involved in cell wall biosynthesis